MRLATCRPLERGVRMLRRIGMGAEMRETERREMDVEALGRMSLGELLYYVLFGDGRVRREAA
jgi:hypothetical protein